MNKEDHNQVLDYVKTYGIAVSRMADANQKRDAAGLASAAAKMGVALAQLVAFLEHFERKV